MSNRGRKPVFTRVISVPGSRVPAEAVRSAVVAEGLWSSAPAMPDSSSLSPGPPGTASHFDPARAVSKRREAEAIAAATISPVSDPLSSVTLVSGVTTAHPS